MDYRTAVDDPLGQLRLRFTELRLLHEGPAAQVYAGKDFTGADVTVAVLTEPAAGDPRQRAAFAEAVRRHSFVSRPGESTVYTADVRAARPWAATRQEAGLTGAERLLAELGAPPADPAGPLSAGPAAPPPAGASPSSVVATPAPSPVPPPTRTGARPTPTGPRRHPLVPVVVAIVIMAVALLALCCFGLVLASGPQ